MLLKRDPFSARLAAEGLSPLRRRAPTTLQLNVGRLCNQACRHCHVDAGPEHTELMPPEVATRVLQVLAASPAVRTVDITGGAPELAPVFRTLVDGARRLGREVAVRCNLTVLLQPGQEDLPRYYASRRVHVISSLPCYTADNVDRQRGGGVFAGSIEALRRLNAVGYGAAEGAPAVPGEPAPLRLDLVYNPLGPTLPPPQAALERDYRTRLAEDHGLRFDRLLTLANMPIHRFADDLRRSGRLEAYEELLSGRFNPRAVADLMCRDLLSVRWDGRLSDCDFNQMLDVPSGAGAPSIFDLDDLAVLEGAPVATDRHCLGCTAGQGSSCGGALDTSGPA